MLELFDRLSPEENVSQNGDILAALAQIYTGLGEVISKLTPSADEPENPDLPPEPAEEPAPADDPEKE